VAGEAAETEPGSGKYTVASVARALRLVEAVVDGPPDGLTVSDLATALGTSKSTAYALARTLVDAGYLRDVPPGPRYQPGMALVRHGDVAGQRFPLGRLCHPVMVELSRSTGLTIRCAVPERGYPVFIERVDAPGAIRFHAPLGVRELPHTSSAGKAILATMPEGEVRALAAECGLPRRTRKSIATVEELLADLEVTRRRGFAVDDEEDVEGVFCVGAACYDHLGRCLGALSATGIKLDLPAHRVEELGRAVRGAAEEVGTLVGGGRAVRAVP